LQHGGSEIANNPVLDFLSKKQSEKAKKQMEEIGKRKHVEIEEVKGHKCNICDGIMSVDGKDGTVKACKIQPCNHIICTDCKEQVKTCPQCRGDIKGCADATEDELEQFKQMILFFQNLK